MQLSARVETWNRRIAKHREILMETCCVFFSISCSVLKVLVHVKKKYESVAPVSSVGRAGIPCTEALYSLQWPRFRIRPAALCCVSSPLSLILFPLNCPVNKAINAKKYLRTSKILKVKKAEVHTNRSSSLPQQPLLLKHLISSPTFNSFVMSQSHTFA